MLVLSRKVGEKIVLPDLDIEIAIVSINGSRVRLGISAPQEISVRRHEIAVHATCESLGDRSLPCDD